MYQCSQCVINSLIKQVENLRYGLQIDAAGIRAPLFVLGIWRSGTTFLHTLLSLDERFAYPNWHHVICPHTFFTTQFPLRLFHASEGKRPQDNVEFNFNTPQEDEFALCAMTNGAAYLSALFPKNKKHYSRYYALRGVSDKELTQWKSALKWFFKKLSFASGRPLILKSPGHTCRIRHLLDLFPDAKFLHIHRNPHAVFKSMCHTFLFA